VPQHDVGREQQRVGGREGDPDGLDDQANVGQQVHADDGQHQGQAIAFRTRGNGGQRDHRQELDGRHGAQRESIDGQVEAAVHRRQYGTPGE